MSYKSLEIWIVANEQVIETHENVKATIVEGYGRKIYKSEYLKFLVYSLASNDETKEHACSNDITPL